MFGKGAFEKLFGMGGNNGAQPSGAPKTTEEEIDAAYQQHENTPRPSGLTVAQEEEAMWNQLHLAEAAEEEARQAGVREDITEHERDLAVEEIYKVAEATNSSASRQIYEIMRIADKNDVSSADLLDGEFQENARRLLGAAISDSLHVFGVPVEIKKFAVLMGPEFCSDPEVRKTVLNGMAKQAKHIESQNTPSGLKALIEAFSFIDEEMQPFMTVKVMSALENERWTSEEINDAHTEWLMEWERQGKGEMRGYEEEFNNRTEMPKRRPK